MTDPTPSGREPGPDRGPLALFRDPEFLALASVRFVSSMAFATIIIALALYADLFQASGVAAGLFGTAYALVRLVFVLPLGRKIDLGNSKRYLLLGLAFNVAMLVGFTFVGTIEHVIVLRGFQSIGSILLWVTGIAVVGEIAPEGARGLWVGTYSQVRAIASLAGDVVGGGLLFLYGFETTYTVLIGLTVVSTALVVLFVRDDPGTRADPDDATGLETYLTLLKRRAVRALVVFRFTFSFGKMAVVIFLPIYARTAFGMNALLIGGVLAGGKITKGLAQGRVGEFADRVGHYDWFIVAGTIGYALGTGLIPAASYVPPVVPPLTVSGLGRAVTIEPPFFVLFVAYALLGLADSLRLPTSMSMFVQEGEYFDAAAASLSLRSVAWQVGAIAGPLAVGATLDYFSFVAAFWLAAAFMVFSGGVFAYLYQAEPAPESAAMPTDDD